MKKILGLTIAVLLIIGIVGGGTWAYFSDVETSEDNVFTAGTLNLVPTTTGTGAKMVTNTSGDGINNQVTFEKLAPGDSGTITWELQNTGNLAGYLTVKITRTADDDNVFNEPEDSISGTYNDGDDGTADGDLDDNMVVKIEADLNDDGDFSDVGKIILASSAGSLETYVEDALTTIIDDDAVIATGGAGDTVTVKLT